MNDETGSNAAADTGPAGPREAEARWPVQWTNRLQRLASALQRHQVEVVHDGEEAVAALSRSEPEVVLLDMSLPGLDGLEVARRIRARGGAHRPLLVAVTGLGRDEDRRRSADAGFDHHLVKPIDLASLMALMDAGSR